jgi:hypothetical protein
VDVQGGEKIHSMVGCLWRVCGIWAWELCLCFSFFCLVRLLDEYFLLPGTSSHLVFMEELGFYHTIIKCAFDM